MESGGHEDDELDALLQKYEAQAQKDISSAQEAARPKKRARITAAEQRVAALAQPLPASNKGFQLLARMGYREGRGIGAAEGRVEPVSVDVKQNKLGLGAVNKAEVRREEQRRREAALSEHAELQQRVAEDELSSRRESFQQRTADEYATRRVEKHLRAALAICETLDRRAAINDNVMWQGEQEAEELSRGEPDGGGVLEGRAQWQALGSEAQLGTVTNYLRTRHIYCVNCGVQYETEEELAAQCPGPSEDAHCCH